MSNLRKRYAPSSTRRSGEWIGSLWHHHVPPAVRKSTDSGRHQSKRTPQLADKPGHSNRIYLVPQKRFGGSRRTI